MKKTNSANRQYILDFLKDLQSNNSKEWMDDHRKRYHKAKLLWLQVIECILERLAKHDRLYETVESKSTLSRITNNRMFHPDKPVYKDFFSCQPSGKNEDGALLFFAIGPGQSFIGGGLWKPEKEAIDRIRDAIDYDGDELKRILASKRFSDFYGGLGDDPDKLKTSPQNYSTDHPHIDLLRHKNFIVQHPISEGDFISDGFIDTVEEAYLAIVPFAEYLKKALTVEA